MPEFISRRQEVTVTEYRHDYEEVACPGAGCSFDCDEHGQIIITRGNARNVLRSRIGAEVGTMIDLGMQKYEHSYTQPAIMRCECGGTVALESAWANECSRCEREYNMSGQRLAPRSQWGEETGESLSDILVGGREDW